MTLARAAADRALDDIAAPPPMAAIPGSSAAAIAQAEDLGRRRAPDYGKLFAHLSRAVRQTMLLEAHIAEDHPPSPGRGAPHGPASHADTTPQPHHEHHEALRRDIVERLDCALADHADGQIPVEDLLLTISQKFGLDTGPAHQPGPLYAKPAAPEPEQSNAPPAAHQSKAGRQSIAPCTIGGQAHPNRPPRPPDC